MSNNNYNIRMTILKIIYKYYIKITNNFILIILICLCKIIQIIFKVSINKRNFECFYNFPFIFFF